MQIEVINPIQQTLIFVTLGAVILLFSARRANHQSFFPVSLTTELKGFAILAIIFSHIGYFLARDHSFLFPISILAGVGVNLFLFLSGFGLTKTSLKSPLSVLDFYKKRLLKLFVPLWLILILFYLLDSLVLRTSYDLSSIVRSFLGIFTTANLYQAIDSPLWYFTLILFYYLVFPLIFKKGKYFFSPILIYLFSVIVVRFVLPTDWEVLSLYTVHLIAFPLGVLFALVLEKKDISQVLSNVIKSRLLKESLRVLLVLVLVFVVGFTAINSGVGKGLDKEQALSLVTMVSLVVIFILKKVEFGVFKLFGQFSYEIYLLHWPLMYRYDVFYTFLPAWLGTLLYLGLFLVLGFLMQKLIELLSKRLFFIK